MVQFVCSCCSENFLENFGDVAENFGPGCRGRAVRNADGNQFAQFLFRAKQNRGKILGKKKNKFYEPTRVQLHSLTTLSDELIHRLQLLQAG